ncbi:MAG TPA: sugar transferase [Candidatus Paceibacterota bacterium]|nr:sugar transferase [Candidatus Paceibacterota bacterium]
MDAGNKLKVFLFFVADAVALYAALFITLIIRYGSQFYEQFEDAHVVPFTIIFVLWIIVFYIAGLYDLRRLRNNLEFLKTLSLCLGVNAALAIALFYLIPAFGIAPKTNLAIFIVIFAVIEIFWRQWLNNAISSGEAPNKVFLVGAGGPVEELTEMIRSNPQIGYEIKEWVPHNGEETLAKIRDAVEKHAVNMVVVPRHLKQDRAVANLLYEILSHGTEVHDFSNFYELVMRKVPLSELEETWFLENLFLQNSFSTFFKRITDFVFVTLLTIVAIPLFPIIALCVALSSRGPIIFTQRRVGKNGVLYDHYKFRTMYVNDRNEWLEKDSARVTPVGTVLRSTHLDELPQIWNVLRGDISLVGPRPDFIDFYDQLKDKIPYYNIRTIIKPGLTGWAQVNFPRTLSAEETKERLSYDLYYLKNRSAVIDVLIILKTIRTVVGALGK